MLCQSFVWQNRLSFLWKALCTSLSGRFVVCFFVSDSESAIAGLIEHFFGIGPQLLPVLQQPRGQLCRRAPRRAAEKAAVAVLEIGTIRCRKMLRKRVDRLLRGSAGHGHLIEGSLADLAQDLLLGNARR